MKREVIILLLLAAIPLLGEAAASRRIVPVQIKLSTFFLELAADDEARADGLMWRRELAENGGMLFVFPGEQLLFFWMKNTLIPLDIIYLNRDMEIVKIHENVQPCRSDPCETYGSVVPALYVIELRAGKARELELAPGDRILIRID